MPNVGTMRLEGGQQLERAMSRLPVQVQRRVLKPSVDAGAKPITAAARGRAPRETGLLRIALGKRSKVYKGSGTAVAVVGARSQFKSKKAAAIREAGGAGTRGARRNPAFYAHLVEFGTSVHWIRAAQQGVLAFLGIVTKVVQHPGSRPQPFMRPAFDSRSHKALSEMTKRLWKGIQKESAKLT